MISRKYSPLERRALNQIWAAAEDYALVPPFLAFTPDGAPDLYINSIIGLACKWFGSDTLCRLFESYAGDPRCRIFDDLVWLALENAVFEKESPLRPALLLLRQEHARDYFAQEYLLSRQQWMEKNSLVYSMQAFRWKQVLGQRRPLLSPREHALAAALAFPASLTPDTLPGAVQALLRGYFAFGGRLSGFPPVRIHFSDRWAFLLTKLLPTELVRRDDLLISHGGNAASAGTFQAPKVLRGIPSLAVQPLEDKKYIESSFGKCLYPERQMAEIERALCTGNHFQNHLWFSAGISSVADGQSAEEKRLIWQAEKQREENRKYFEAHRRLYRSCILRLSAQIENSLMIHRQTVPEQARSGCLEGQKVWRAVSLHDSRIFCRPCSDTDAGLRVDLVLDASASRLHCQETIAAQGYILAESLRLCNVPVQVSAFCSLRGYTVVRLFKRYDQPERNAEIFRYFAAGWNRDGLALRAEAYLMDSDPSPARHLLILLTDASPSDSTRIAATSRHPFGRDYGDRAAVEDTAEQVRALRRHGTRVAAVFFGEDSSLPAAKQIFGHDFVRIRRMDQLASAVGRLIERQLDLLA